MIKGKLLRDAIISAANSISNQRSSIDELNIFPVPDGDTGTNMSMTINAAVKELYKLGDDCTASEVAKCAASAMLRGARGNSGVITSLLFRGFSKGLEGKKEASGADLANALTIGVDAAYKAVMKPTEGTILTVARFAAEKGRELSADASKSTQDIWNGMCDGADDALKLTPELLPILKKAGIVDAGGKGLVIILRGMKVVFDGGDIIESATDNRLQTDADFEAVTRNAAAEYEGEITFTYCTEFIIERTNSSDALQLRAYLESIGDSVVVVDDDEIIKVHVHTEDPGDAISHGLQYGAMISNKIENMRKQHERLVREKSGQEEKTETEMVEEFGFVAVAAGEGNFALFTDLGVNKVVSGGQTMNPSTEDILKAVQCVPARTVFVLPNNKNIILAAQQTIPMSDRRVIVVPTKTIPQGISAMMSFDPDASAEDNFENMSNASSLVSTGQITFAARDSELFDGQKIKQNEIIALDNGRLVFSEKTPVKAATRLLKSMIKKDCQFINIIYGEGINEEQALEVKKYAESKSPNDAEVLLIEGGQPVYYFIMSVE